MKFKCPHCDKRISVHDDAAGKKGKCPGCKRSVRVPTAESMAAAQLEVKAVPPQPVQMTRLPPPLQRTAPPLQRTEAMHGDYAPAFSPVQVNVQYPSRAAHSLGIASLVLGVLSFFVCWLPFIGMFFGGVGFLLGGAGLVLAVARKGSGIGFSIAGTATSAVALITGFVVTYAVAGTFAGANRVTSDNDGVSGRRSQSVMSPSSFSSSKNPMGSPVNEPAWLPADSTLQLGNIRVEITEVVIGHVPLRSAFSDAESQSEDELLSVWVRVTNTSERKKIDYQGWMSDYASLLGTDASLTDDANNHYRKISFSSLLSVKGAENPSSIYPSKSITDVLVFEVPVEGIKYLRLKLSGKAFGEDGEFRFEIPREMIARK